MKIKPWRMRKKTRKIVSEAYVFCQELNQKYDQRVTIRQIYYHLFSKGTVEKYEEITNALKEGRKRGYIPFDWIEDRSRQPIWDMMYQNIEHFLKSLKDKYLRNTWVDQETFIIILVEKDALASIIWDIAKDYRVFVFPTKGFASWSMFVGNIRTLVNYFGVNKKLIVLILSDLDPSGEYIKEDYENKFKFMTEELGFPKPSVMEKIAITDEQVKQHNLPLIKKKYKKRGIIEIVELDALDPRILREIVKQKIEDYIDLNQLQEDVETEAKERDSLEFLIKHGIESVLEDER